VKAMKRITYAGQSFLTADRAADALVNLTAALGQAQNAEVVEMPAVDREGVTRQVRLVIGPASQLAAVPEDSTFDEPEARDVIAHLEERTRALGRQYGSAGSYRTSSEFDLDELDGI
jgi:hypothetical protein